MFPIIKFHHAIQPAAILDDTAATSTVLDLASYPGAKGILWVFGLGATDIAPAVMKIQEADAKSDATTLTTPSDVKDFTTKHGATDDGKLWGVYVPLDEARKQYQQAAYTAGDGAAGTFVWCIAIPVGGDHDFNAASFGFGNYEQA